MSNRLSAASLAAIIVTIAVPAQGADAQAVLALMKGTTISGQYASGARFAETFLENGSTRYTDTDGTIVGRVTTQDGSLCFSYPGVDTLNGGCFTVERRGDNCFDFYATDNSATPFQRRNGLGWTARAWQDDRPGTCEAAAIS